MPVADRVRTKTANIIYMLTGAPRLRGVFAKLGKHTIGKSYLYIRKLADADRAVLKTLVVQSVADIQSRYPS